MTSRMSVVLPAPGGRREQEQLARAGPPAVSLDILDLLPQLLAEHLGVDDAPRGLRCRGSSRRACSARAATPATRKSSRFPTPPSPRTISPKCARWLAQAIELLAHVRPVHQQDDLLRQPFRPERIRAARQQLGSRARSCVSASTATSARRASTASTIPPSSRRRRARAAARLRSLALARAGEAGEGRGESPRRGAASSSAVHSSAAGSTPRRAGGNAEQIAERDARFGEPRGLELARRPLPERAHGLAVDAHGDGPSAAALDPDRDLASAARDDRGDALAHAGLERSASSSRQPDLRGRDSGGSSSAPSTSMRRRAEAAVPDP